MHGHGRGERDGPVRLHLLRHAHAGDPDAWEGDDALRPLTQKGRRQSERLGRFLAERGIRPDVIVSSPKVRALQTAEIVAAGLGMTVRLDERLADGFGKRELWASLDELGAREPMLVGHDPDLSELLRYLVDAAGVSLRKSALATVDLPTRLGDGDADLRWLVPPDLLELAES
jgi:phosphohistidine phosphatase